jgi:hypothetical protein
MQTTSRPRQGFAGGGLSRSGFAWSLGGIGFRPCFCGMCFRRQQCRLCPHSAVRQCFPLLKHRVAQLYDGLSDGRRLSHSRSLYHVGVSRSRQAAEESTRQRQSEASCSSPGSYCDHGFFLRNRRSSVARRPDRLCIPAETVQARSFASRAFTRFAFVECEGCSQMAAETATVDCP